MAAAYAPWGAVVSASESRRDDAAIPITFFKSFGAHEKKHETLSLHELANRISTTTRARKEWLPWLKLAEFGDIKTEKNSLRHDANVLTVSGVEVDYDDEKISSQEAIERLTKAGILSIFYTSPRHTEETPRWRVLAPTSCVIKPEHPTPLAARTNGVFNGKLANESWTLSQSYYFGSVNNNPSHHVEVIDGTPIDLLDELDEIWCGPPETKPGYTATKIGPLDEVALLGAIAEGRSYHEASVRLLGRWARNGVPYMDARARLIDAMEHVFPLDRDDRWRERRSDVDRCLEDIYGKQAKVRDAGVDTTSQAPTAKANEPPAIRVINGELSDAVTRGEQALIRADLGIYQRSTFIVRPGVVRVTASTGRKIAGQRILVLGENGLLEAMTAACPWEIYDNRSSEWVRRDCPSKVVKALRDRAGRWELPVLAGIVNAPTLRSDGSILDKPGYDEATGLLFDAQGVNFPAIPDQPTKADAHAALKLLDGLIATFNYVTPADRSVALSAMLTCSIRRAIATAPMHAFSAPLAGSGKSMQVDLCSLMVVGREAGVISQGKTEAEFEKRLGSELLAGESLIAIDNVEEPIGGELLCSMLTQTVVKPRILGKSLTPELPSNAFVTATGNNLTFVGDVTRRTVLCQLDPKCERPEKRKFTKNPLQEMRDNRAAYLVAALTILRAYHIAGRPQQRDPLGSFSEWSRWVRDALVWLGRADPVNTMEDARATDPKLAKLQAVIAEWADALDTAKTTAKGLIEAATAGSTDAWGKFIFNRPDFREALLVIAGAGGAINSEQLGKWLRDNKERVIGDYRIDRGTMLKGSSTWHLTKGGRA